MQNGITTLLLASLFGSSFSQTPDSPKAPSKTMTVEIWSDVMCPFCYIGKRKFEAALAQFPYRDQVVVEWKSFQLDPQLKTDPTKNVHQSLAEKKGWTPEHTREMSNHVTNMAQQVGLTYDFDRAVVANSFDAHRLSHLAKAHDLQDQLEERLFAAYFTEGKNTADSAVLVQLGTEAGVPSTEITLMLASDQYADAVRKDIYEAQQVGVTGVPFFVLDGRYSISGAQETALFLRALNQIWAEIAKEATH